MPEIRMRPKHQVTLPVSIVREAGLETDDKLTVCFINGSIVLTPQRLTQQQDDVLSYAGIFSGAWGNTPEESIQTMQNLRNEWTQ